MAIDPQLLELLVCPVDKTPLELIELPPAVCERLVEHFRPQFKDEEPEVHEALCSPAGRVYPIVSDIPVMLVDEALSLEEVQAARS